MVAEVGRDQFAANNVTKAMAGAGGAAGINYLSVSTFNVSSTDL